VTGAGNDVAGSLPDVPSPKEIAGLPKKAAQRRPEQHQGRHRQHDGRRRGGRGRVLPTWPQGGSPASTPKRPASPLV